MSVSERRGTNLPAWEPTVGAGILAVLLVGLWATVGLGPMGWLAGAAYAVALWTLLTFALRRSRARWMGPANRVTLVRSALVGGVTALVADHAGDGSPTAVLVALATVALVLDAVDGYVARRTGSSTALGARFDMEVDAFLILVLSVFVAGSLGAWVLAIGVMRYAFAVAGWTLPWLRAPLPPSFARKTIAAAQGTVLTVASSGLLAHLVAVAAVGAALAALVWSFGRDVAWLWRVREGRAPGSPNGG